MHLDRLSSLRHVRCMDRSTWTAARAVIYAPRGTDAQRWINLCVDYCARSRYDVVHVQIGGAETHWPALARWLLDGKADVIVTARPEHLPPTRTPRVEAVSDVAATLSARARIPAQRRARRVAR